MTLGNHRRTANLLSEFVLRTIPPRFSAHVTQPDRAVLLANRNYALNLARKQPVLRIVIHTHWPATDKVGWIAKSLIPKYSRPLGWSQEQLKQMIENYQTFTRCRVQCLVCTGWRKPCYRCLNPKAPVMTTLHSCLFSHISQETRSSSPRLPPKGLGISRVKDEIARPGDVDYESDVPRERGFVF